MAGETLVALRTEFLARGFDGVDPVRADRFINEGQRRVCRAALWPFLHKADMAQPNPFFLPALRAVRSVTVDGREVEGALPYLHHVPSDWQTATGPARAYLFDPSGGGIITYPFEAGITLTIFYYRHPPLLALDTDQALVPDTHSGVLLDAACLVSSKDLKEWDNVAGYRDELAQGLNEMRDELLDPQFSNAEIIEVPEL